MNSNNPDAIDKVLAVEPLVVRPSAAARLLGCSRVYLYEMLSAGELESYTDGSARKITMRSIYARIERKLRESRQSLPAKTASSSRGSP
jgi:excisionase family DNA binding protein